MTSAAIQGERRLGPSQLANLSERLSSLDGWRAISILMVLGAHCHRTPGFPDTLRQPFTWLFDGDLGVRFFFVISGFLITWLMLLEHRHYGWVSLKAFYARRALRILPVYFAFLLTVAILQWLTPYRQSARAWAGNLTFTTNFLDSEFTTGHLWSLSTEEQFYLLWPGLFVLLAIGSNPGKAFRILGLAVVAAPVCRVIGYKGHPEFLFPVMRHFSFFAFFDSLAVGCAAAVLLATRRDLVSKHLESRPRRAAALGLMLVGIPYVLMKLRWLRPLTVPFGPSAQAFGLGLLLLLSVLFPRWGAFRGLNWRLVARIGVLSYSIYIWQQIFCTTPQVFGLRAVWWMSFPGWLVPVFVVSSISYYGFERPLLKLRARFRRT